MSAKTIRIATRQSPLALWQAHFIKNQLLAHWPSLHIELLPLVTSGDTFLKEKLLVAGGKGLFVKELEEALLDKRADIAVHSTKDMPADLPPNLSLAIICERHNPWDAFVSHEYANLNLLPQKAIVGTASLRRQSQLLAYRPDLQINVLRGNIHTRLAKLQAGEYHAIILAAAGLERMGLHQSISELLPEELMLPSCGQGALCIECREDDESIRSWINVLHHADSTLCITAERKVNAKLGGNCHVPLAVYCSITEQNKLHLRAKILSADGEKIIQYQRIGSKEAVDTIVEDCVQTLLQDGAAALINSSR